VVNDGVSVGVGVGVSHEVSDVQQKN
jgi:hypothetical protein